MKNVTQPNQQYISLYAIRTSELQGNNFSKRKTKGSAGIALPCTALAQRSFTKLSIIISLYAIRTSDVSSVFLCCNEISCSE